ncbi:PRD domain-containing protein [Jeotgalibaca ciconiae]|uniref:PRD domain-containing protein n=1 Tax=Jeotgalibaca ciconiae TaxID=2496265 RepID=A0A3S9H9E3_9LACT|nr:PRD domain-containing protein [Jeotgalibaca ciconiae]AZP03992.1 PRD domain-containing protein [Jeotgalibaca ciconiae]HJB23175.1 PRD domain-containing protein [Candidatus Jeotgalibaca pullicola]
MKVIKKINNNVAICLDANENELVAFGKGIGFPKIPYELTDLSKISMTFYQIDFHYYKLLSEIPSEILDISIEAVRIAQQQLKNFLNPNMVFSLADHIHFAITRVQKLKNMKLVFSYDVEHFYPQETELGKFVVKLIQKRLHITLPDSEITNIAMHFVNGQMENEVSSTEQSTEDLIEVISQKIEDTFQMELNRNEFNYNRLVMHLRYYIIRLQEEEQFMDSNEMLFQTMKENMPKVYHCAAEIAKLIQQSVGKNSTDDELLYLMIHINRVIKNTQ